MGKRRFQQSVPLHEVVRAFCVIKESMVAFIEEEGIPSDPLGLYAEEQMQHRIGRFFDTLIVHPVRGYETAWAQGRARRRTDGIRQSSARGARFRGRAESRGSGGARFGRAQVRLLGRG
jgi:hypothetical protein